MEERFSQEISIGLHPNVHSLHGCTVHHGEMKTTASLAMREHIAHLLTAAKDHGHSVEVIGNVESRTVTLRGDAAAALRTYQEKHGVTLVEYPLQ